MRALIPIQFIETMMYKYDALAKERGVTIVSACGFDSVPTDIGVKHLQTYCQQKNLGLDAVEMFFELCAFLYILVIFAVNRVLRAALVIMVPGSLQC